MRRLVRSHRETAVRIEAEVVTDAPPGGKRAGCRRAHLGEIGAVIDAVQAVHLDHRGIDLGAAVGVCTLQRQAVTGTGLREEADRLDTELPGGERPGEQARPAEGRRRDEIRIILHRERGPAADLGIIAVRLPGPEQVVIRCRHLGPVVPAHLVLGDGDPLLVEGRVVPLLDLLDAVGRLITRTGNQFVAVCHAPQHLHRAFQGGLVRMSHVFRQALLVHHLNALQVERRLGQQPPRTSITILHGSAIAPGRIVVLLHPVIAANFLETSFPQSQRGIYILVQRGIGVGRIRALIVVAETGIPSEDMGISQFPQDTGDQFDVHDVVLRAGILLLGSHLVGIVHGEACRPPVAQGKRRLRPHLIFLPDPTAFIGVQKEIRHVIRNPVHGHVEIPSAIENVTKREIAPQLHPAQGCCALCMGRDLGRTYRFPCRTETAVHDAARQTEISVTDLRGDCKAGCVGRILPQVAPGKGLSRTFRHKALCLPAPDGQAEQKDGQGRLPHGQTYFAHVVQDGTLAPLRWATGALSTVKSFTELLVS